MRNWESESRKYGRHFCFSDPTLHPMVFIQLMAALIQTDDADDCISALCLLL
jgi:hypothetical protein